MSMYTRNLRVPDKDFWLLGPRDTGKSTWLRANFPGALVVDLLAQENVVRYEREPGLLRSQVLARPTTDWIVIDEVQRVPKLLDEVRYLMEEEGYERFALVGSSARKLRRGGTDRLAGHPGLRHLYPLTARETGYAVPIEQLMRYGSLPLSVAAEDDDAREGFLRSYATTYLVEEVRAEGLVRDPGSYSRFLEVAAMSAGQRTNISALARDAGVARDTARGYLDVLIDTLIADWLPAYRPGANVKETALPKLYWFDTGVLNAAVGAFDQPTHAEWDGVLLEHLLLHEIRAYLDYGGVKGSLGYWATPSGTEVDFIWWHGSKTVGIDVKASRKFRMEYTTGSRKLRSRAGVAGARTYVVYLGDEELLEGGVKVLPVESFLRRLHAGEILRD